MLPTIKQLNWGIYFLQFMEKNEGQSLQQQKIKNKEYSDREGRRRDRTSGPIWFIFLKTLLKTVFENKDNIIFAFSRNIYSLLKCVFCVFCIFQDKKGPGTKYVFPIFIIVLIFNNRNSFRNRNQTGTQGHKSFKKCNNI